MFESREIVFFKVKQKILSEKQKVYTNKQTFSDHEF